MSTSQVRTAGVWELVRPKWVMQRRRLGGEGSELRVAVLGLIGAASWALWWAK